MLIGSTSLHGTNFQMKDRSFLLVPSKVIVSVLSALKTKISWDELVKYVYFKICVAPYDFFSNKGSKNTNSDKL